MNTSRVKKSKYVSVVVLAVMLAVMLAATTSACKKSSSPKNIKITGVDGPFVGYSNGQFVMSMIIKNLSYDVGVRIPVPKTVDSFLEVGPDLQSNGTLVSIALSAVDIQNMTRNGLSILDPMTLPGGRPLPGVIEGHLPAIAVEVPKLKNIVFYAGPAVFGTFIPVVLPWKDYIGSFRFYDGTGLRVGNLSIVGQDSDESNSGLLLLVDIKGHVKKLMDYSLR